MEAESALETTRPSGGVRGGDMLDFLHRWYLYEGGLAADMFVQFGLTPAACFSRVLDLLHHDHPSYSPVAMVGMR